MRNIDKFDEITGIIFAMLYESFPVRIDFTPGDIVKKMEALGKVDSIEQGEEAFDDLTQFIPATVRWLQEEGYITLEATTLDRHFLNASLSSKGLSALKATPSSVEGKSSVGEQLSDAAKTGGRDILVSATNQVLAAGIRLALSSV